jgi:hypothetical protein
MLAGEEHVFRYEKRKECSRWARESFKDAILIACDNWLSRQISEEKDFAWNPTKDWAT